jgi:hypothetical protein
MTETTAPYRMPKTKIRPLIEDVTHSGPVSDDMPNVENWTDRESVAGAFKSFNWPEMRHADCTMHHASIILFENGTGRFFSNVRTNDADDTWLILGIALRDEHGIELWRTPKFVGPNMVIDDFEYIFTIDPVFFPAHLFTSISFLTMYHHC